MNRCKHTTLDTFVVSKSKTILRCVSCGESVATWEDVPVKKEKERPQVSGYSRAILEELK